GDDLVGEFQRVEGDRTRTLHLAVDVHRAGATLRDAATILGAGETDLLPEHPQERRLRSDIDVLRLAIHIELRHSSPPPKSGKCGLIASIASERAARTA